MHQIWMVALLSWSLLVCWGTSRHQRSSDCKSGWFGSTCQFKCRCRLKVCDNEGLCLNSDRCLGGWFGPACQYADLAYETAALKPVTDGDDTTCISDTSVNSISIQLRGYYIISWVRVFVSTPGYLHNLRFTVGHNGTYGNCTQLSIYAPDETTRDLECDFKGLVNSIAIAGVGMSYLCSLHVSGGRNVALKQKTEQSSVYSENSISYTSDFAVDGNTDRNLYEDLCAHTDINVWPQWVVKLSSPKIVNRYVIHNRDGNPEVTARLKGFRLASYDQLNRPVFIYTDVQPTTQQIYTIVHADLGIGSVEIFTASKQLPLTLCEVEIYGDSNCTSEYYGFECQKKCNCYFQDTCFVRTGGCLKGCATGYMGEDCNTICPLGRFGNDCKFSCSQYCVQNNQSIRTCKHLTGDCLRGCQLGYQPPTCMSACGPGKFGTGCSKHCSPACRSPPGNKNNTCDVLNGTCLYGCDAGYDGPSCSTSCQPNHYGDKCKFFCSRGCVPSNHSSESPCHHVTGECRFGCDYGRNGTRCELVVRPTTEKQNLALSTKYIVTASILSMACVMLMLVAAMFCVQRPSTLKSFEESISSDLSKE
ncbi:hypothetical protein BsWGS_24555 [Bradybaena similaris]